MSDLAAPQFNGVHQQVQKALRSGTLAKSDRCERCGESFDDADLIGHHDDYTKALAVRWLCRPCHATVHQFRRQPTVQENFAPLIIPAILAELSRRGLSRYWLAKQIGVQERSIYDMLQRPFGVDRADAMLRALGLRIEADD